MPTVKGFDTHFELCCLSVGYQVLFQHHRPPEWIDGEGNVPISDSVLGANIKQDHAEDDEGEVDGFGLQVLLMEYHCTHHERHDHAATTDHRHDGDHRAIETEAVEIDEVGC